MNSLPVKFLFTYSVQETSRRMCYYCLSFVCCFLVAFTTLIVNSLLSQSPVIYLVLAQNDLGEIDMKLDPVMMQTKVQNTLEDEQFFYSFLNYTKYSQILNENGLSLGSSPRVFLEGLAGKNATDFIYYAQLAIINTEQERKISLGKAYNYDKLGEGECNILKSLADQVGVNEGDNIYLQMDFTTYFINMLISNSNSKFANPINFTQFTPININFPCLVKNILPTSQGKAPNDFKKLAFMEMDNFPIYAAKYLPSNLTKIYPEVANYLKNIPLSEYASTIVSNFPNPRPLNYLNSDYNAIVRKCTAKANELSRALGKDFNVGITLPIVNALKGSSNASVFLGLMLYMTIFILFFLSIILIYSLLTITLETSSLELGILRLIGTNKNSVIYIVLMQCLFFSVPAYILAFIAQFPVFRGVSRVLSNLSSSDININISSSAIFLSLFLTNLAPLLAAIIPVREILSKNLSTALNTKLSKTSGMKIEIVSINDEQQNILLIFGILTFFYGISIYYFLPLALLSFNLVLLLSIFLLILIGMLLGFVLLSLNIENLVQKFFTYLFFFWIKSYFLEILFKNLYAHKVRNRKTSLMYCLSVGFFILITVGYNGQTSSLKYQRLSLRGGYLVVTSSSDYLTPSKLNTSLSTLINKNLIQDFSFVTPSLNVFERSINNIAVSNQGKSFSVGVNLNGVGHNFYNTTVNQFLMIQDLNKFYKMELSEYLYMKEMSGKIGMSGYFTYYFGLDLDESFLLILNDKDSNQMQFLFQPAFLLKNSPTLQMSNQPSLMGKRSVIVPMHIYLDLIKKTSYYFNTKDDSPPSFSYKDSPVSQVILKVEEIISTEVYSEIYSVFENDPDIVVSIWSYQEFATKIDNTNRLINFLFGFINIIVFIFCFFNLSASMSINIFEQTKEITIYRALGVPKNVLVFIYISEAFILILSSSFVGLIIGTILSWTMTIQRVLFTNLPLTFEFPYGQLIAIFIASIIGSFSCTIFPARKILNKGISEIMKLG